MNAVVQGTKLKHTHSLKRKTWRFFLILLSLFCVIFVTSYVLTIVRAAVDNAVSASETAMINMNKNIRLTLERYNEMSRQIMINADVVEFLRDTDSGKMYNATKIRNGINSVITIYSYVDSVYVFRLDGEAVWSGGGITLVDKSLMATPEWNMPLLEAKGGSVMMINGGGVFHRQSGAPLITMARLIYDLDTQQVTGVLVVNLLADVLYSTIKHFAGDGRQVCFFDRYGHVLWGDESLQDSFRPEFAEGGFWWEELSNGRPKRIFSAYSTPDVPIVQVSVSNVHVTGLQSWEAIWIAIILVAAVVLAVVSSGAFISINMARPIDLLTEAINNTKSNEMLQEIELSLPNNEIRRLADSYNSMIVHINRLITELIEKEKSIQKAEMRTLHEQIKPHFLYNSLETISYMALQSKAPQVHDALETLGSFYRNFLSKGSKEIPIKTEIMIVKNYLALQKLRYGDVFDDEYDLDEHVLNKKIPKLILQPLVENSLYHGLRLKGEKGIIRISARAENDAIHISVFDTGVGMTQEQINEVLSGEAADENNLSGFGLKGTIERIRYYCNYREVIKINSEPGEYTRIDIIIPD